MVSGTRTRLELVFAPRSAVAKLVKQDGRHFVAQAQSEPERAVFSDAAMGQKPGHPVKTGPNPTKIGSQWAVN